MAPVYVPILKGKEGEYGALQSLGLDIKRKLLPLIEIPSVPRDWELDRPSKPLGEHVERVPDQIGDSWGEDFPVYVDVALALEDQPRSEAVAATRSLLSGFRRRNVQAIPVLWLDSSPEYLAAIGTYNAALERGRRGACIRLTLDDFDDDIDLDEAINKIFDVIEVGIREVDLVVDLRNIQDVTQTLLVIRSLKAILPEPESWRQITLAASSFPPDLSDVDAASASVMERVEWTLWKRRQQRPERFIREDLLFGDYGISHSEPRELDPRVMRMSASIRYTTLNDWLVLKGRNVRQWGFDQYYDLCQELLRRPEYSGETFSWGDTYISRCARRETGPGNATTWRKVGTSHHLTLVAIQLSTPIVP